MKDVKRTGPKTANISARVIDTSHDHEVSAPRADMYTKLALRSLKE